MEGLSHIIVISASEQCTDSSAASKQDPGRHSMRAVLVIMLACGYSPIEPSLVLMDAWILHAKQQMVSMI